MPMKVAIKEIMITMSIPLKLAFLNRISKTQSIIMIILFCLTKKKPMARIDVDAHLFSQLHIIPCAFTFSKGLDVESPSSLSFSYSSNSSTSTMNERKINKRSVRRLSIGRFHRRTKLKNSMSSRSDSMSRREERMMEECDLKQKELERKSKGEKSSFVANL